MRRERRTPAGGFDSACNRGILGRAWKGLPMKYRGAQSDFEPLDCGVIGSFETTTVLAHRELPATFTAGV